ncbi:hypothetical protein QYE76_056878 [Lolium multiflorum]|uniref:Retrotransposon gag domain-containing protein n=1 Tax=Lolium multiflorum TaxID=4521 RepID=A0AAD8T328_LOLMU|nr:hypothetical protein QYE76_056878 [Lolium multiflorum]
MAEEKITYEDLPPDHKKKYDELKAIVEAELIGSFEKTRSHGIRFKGFTPQGVLDGLDLSLPSDERTRALRQEINYVVAHSLHRHSESLVNSLERVAFRVIQEIMERRYSPSGPALGTHQGEVQLHTRPPLPYSMAAPQQQGSPAYVVYKVGGDPGDYQFLYEPPKEIPHGYVCTFVPDCNNWTQSDPGSNRRECRSRSHCSGRGTTRNSRVPRDQFGILPKKKIVGYSKPYPNEFDLIPLPPKYRLPDFNKFSGSEGSSSIEHVSRYLAQLGMVSASDELRVRFFSQSLTGPAFGWYTSLQPNSVRSWKQLEEQFHTQYHSVIKGFVIRHGKDKAESSHSRGKDKEEAVPRDRPQDDDRRYLTEEEVRSIRYQRPLSVHLLNKYEQQYDRRRRYDEDDGKYHRSDAENRRYRRMTEQRREPIALKRKLLGDTLPRLLLLALPYLGAAAALIIVAAVGATPGRLVVAAVAAAGRTFVVLVFFISVVVIAVEVAEIPGPGAVAFGRRLVGGAIVLLLLHLLGGGYSLQGRSSSSLSAAPLARLRRTLSPSVRDWSSSDQMEKSWLGSSPASMARRMLAAWASSGFHSGVGSRKGEDCETRRHGLQLPRHACENISNTFPNVGTTVNVHSFRAKHRALGMHLRSLQRVEISVGRMPPLKPKAPKGSKSNKWRQSQMG